MRTQRLVGDHAGAAALLAIGWLLGMIVLAGGSTRLTMANPPDLDRGWEDLAEELSHLVPRERILTTIQQSLARFGNFGGD